MKCLFVADRVEDLHPEGDTTLYMLREMLSRGWSAYWTTPKRVYWSGTALYADAKEVTASRKRVLPELGDRSTLAFEDGIDAVFIRKDPPFDIDYISLCWLLAAYEDKIRMINKPGLLVRYHEKMPPYDAVARGILNPDDIVPTCLSSELDQIVAFVKGVEEDRIILKPWLGYGGNNIRRVGREDFLKNPGSFELTGGRWMVQPYFDAVESTGDRRGFFFGGKYFGSVVRMPPKGNFVANLAQGGSAVDLELTDKERSLIGRIESWLEKTGIAFAGSDFIDGRLSELNITSPTGFASYEDLYGTDPAKALIDAAFAGEGS